MNAIRIGKKIRCARVVKGMSQDDLADKVGRHRPAISRLEAAAEQAPRLTAELIEDLCRELDMDPWAFFDNSHKALRGRISTHFLYLGYERITDILRECIKDARRIHPDIVRILVLAPNSERKLAVVTSSSVLPGTVGDALTKNIDSLPALTENPFYQVQPVPGDSLTAYRLEMNLCALEFVCGRGAMRIALLEPPDGDDEIQSACRHIGDAFSQAIEVLGPHGPQHDIKALSERVAALEGMASSGQSE
jgi:transcriptional regulator with XRE-family HTH domain